MRGLSHVPLPSIAECIRVNLDAVKLVNPEAKFIGIAVNSSLLGKEGRLSLFKQLSTESGLLVFDPLKDGVTDLVNQMLER